jgi:hypothetical protein
VTDPHPSHPIAVAPPRIALALVDLADCVCAELAETGAGATCWCGLYPGASVSWDYCTECSGGACGMGYVRFAGVFPYDSFPVPTVDFHCAKPTAYALEVGALRCMPQPGDGELADPTTMIEVSLGQLMDAEALYRALKCCGLDIAVERYQPVGPEGGCVGGFWTAYLAID